jgi:hypothetical protein
MPPQVHLICYEWSDNCFGVHDMVIPIYPALMRPDPPPFQLTLPTIYGKKSCLALRYLIWTYVGLVI